MQLSVIIPALNEAVNLSRAVASAHRAGAAEVIVVDGGSQDETCGIASRLDCRLVVSGRGRGIQQNAGARLASGDALLFLHADCQLAGDVGRQIEHTLANPRRLHGALSQRIEAGGMVYRALESGNGARVKWLGLPYGDQAIFIRRTTFDEMGGFPEVPLMEDLILMQCVRRRAWPALLPGPVSISPRRWQERGVVRQTLRNWWLLTRYSLGAKPEALAQLYLPHGGPR